MNVKGCSEPKEGERKAVGPRQAIQRSFAVLLKNVDQFRETDLRYKGDANPPPPSATVEQVGDDMVIKSIDGRITGQMPAAQMNLEEWNRERPWYEELEDRICPLWLEYTRLIRELAFLPTQAQLPPPQEQEERTRMQTRLNRVTSELCTYFREVVRISERTLGASLPDHYRLYEVCY